MFCSAFRVILLTKQLPAGGDHELITYFVVQSFEQARKGTIFANAPVQAHDEAHAIRLAERLSTTKAGVVAFSRSGDPATGEYEDATILVVYGTVSHTDEGFALAC